MACNRFPDAAYLPTEELRARASKTDGGLSNWHLWTREQLIAFFRNRPHLDQPVRIETELTERYT